MRYLKMMGMAMLASALLTACEKEADCEGNTTRQYDHQDFTRITAASRMQIDIEAGNDFSIVAEGCSRDIEDLRLQKKNGGNLEFDFDRNLRHRDPVYIKITMPYLAAANLAGAAEARISGFGGGTGNLRVVLSGASKAQIAGTTIKTQVELSGASELTTSGATDLLYGNISGASRLKAFGTNAVEVELNASGGSEALVTAMQKLTAEATGSSTIRYRGNPTHKETVTSGGGRVIAD